MPHSQQTSAPRPRAVLLDIDGTLLDSNEAHAQAWLMALRQHGLEADHGPVRALIGKGGDKLLGELFGIDDESTEGQRINAKRRHLFERDLLPSLQPTRGARDLLQRFLADGLELIIATSAGADELQGLLRQAGVHDLIALTASSSDAEKSKPDPDIVQAALSKAGMAPGDAVMLGDTPYDIDAARKAGVRTVALRCGGLWDDAALKDAVAIYDDPAHLLRRFADSPFMAWPEFVPSNPLSSQLR